MRVMTYDFMNDKRSEGIIAEDVSIMEVAEL